MKTETEEVEINVEDFDKICRFCYKRSHYMKSMFDEVDEKPDVAIFDGVGETVDTVAMVEANLGLKVRPGQFPLKIFS